MVADCLFCKIADKTIPSQIVFEDDDLLAFNDIAPQAPVHLLVVPKRHLSTLNDLTAADAELIGKMALRAQALAWERGIGKDGYRLAMNCNAQGGQTVFHIHLHLLGGRRLKAMG